jgi:hypothetical protein
MTHGLSQALYAEFRATCMSKRTAMSIAKQYRVPFDYVCETRSSIAAARERRRRHVIANQIRKAHDETGHGPLHKDMNQRIQHDKDRESVAKWVALKITYGSDRRSFNDGGIPIPDLRKSPTSEWRTLGGVVSYEARAA